MVKNVGSKLDEKLKSGEIKESELMKEASELMEKMKNNLIYLAQKNKELETALVEAQSTLIKGGFSKTQVTYSFVPRKKDIASEIIRTVKTENINLIILNHKPGKATHLFTGNIYSKVINAMSNCAVCVVT